MLAAPDLFGFLPIVVTSIGANPPFAVTPFGASFGFSNADMNFPTHNSFGLTGGLNIVDLDASGNATTLAGVAQIDGGAFTPVPEPASILLVGSAVVGAVVRMRRRTRAARQQS